VLEQLARRKAVLHRSSPRRPDTPASVRRRAPPASSRIRVPAES
jgi:hypothetical protein